LFDGFNTFLSDHGLHSPPYLIGDMSIQSFRNSAETRILIRRNPQRLEFNETRVSSC
jgi:hypothetical protein